MGRLFAWARGHTRSTARDGPRVKAQRNAAASTRQTTTGQEPEVDVDRVLDGIRGERTKLR